MADQQIMSLNWRFAPPEEERDIRTFSAFLDLGRDRQPMQLYKFSTIPEMLETVTTFQRFNLDRPALRWEIAGEIRWMRNFTGYVKFGMQTVQIHELRRRKKATSKSRRFTYGGQEYKWKIAANGTDLTCIDSNKVVIGAWSASTQTLRFTREAQPLLDRLVVTCLIHLWFRANGIW